MDSNVILFLFCSLLYCLGICIVGVLSVKFNHWNKSDNGYSISHKVTHKKQKTKSHIPSKEQSVLVSSSLVIGVKSSLVRSSSEIPLYFLTPCTHCAFWLFDCLARHAGGIPQIWSERPWLMFYLPGITTTLTPFRPWGSPNCLRTTVDQTLWNRAGKTAIVSL